MISWCVETSYLDHDGEEHEHVYHCMAPTQAGAEDDATLRLEQLEWAGRLEWGVDWSTVERCTYVVGLSPCSMCGDRASTCELDGHAVCGPCRSTMLREADR